MSISLDSYKLSCELMGHSMDVRSVSAGDTQNDGQQILSGSRDKSVKIWSRMGNEYIQSVTLMDHNNYVSCVYYNKDEKWICTGSNDATVCIYAEGKFVPQVTLKGHDLNVCAIASGIEPRSLITGSWDTSARIWTIDEVGNFKSVVLRGHESAVWTVASMRDAKKFVTGSADKNILYWNDKGEKLRLLKGHTDCVRAILSFNKFSSLVSCANDATIRYWSDNGECVRELVGHTNYIYSLAHNDSLGDNIILSCGEDSTVRMWDLTSGEQLGSPIVLPVQSIWSIACLDNGDIVAGCSDGVVRVFTKDKGRFADESTLNSFNSAVSLRIQQSNQHLGGVKKTDLPGPEALLSKGTQEGQTKIVRHADGSIKCYSWELGNWKLVGDVMGASGGTESTSGKALHEGKEYDFVFSIDISDTQPALKLPYNRDQDPWHAAQTFIHNNNLPQAYLDQIANFIVKNSKTEPSGVSSIPSTSGYRDPFTGGSQYIPGAQTQSTDTSNYNITINKQQSNMDGHFPVSKYITFDNCDTSKVLIKLIEFNGKLPDDTLRVPNETFETFMKLASDMKDNETSPILSMKSLLSWPSDMIFPVLDVARLAVRNEDIFKKFKSFDFLKIILNHMNTSAPNQLMVIRCLANIMQHESGRREISVLCMPITQQINDIKSGSANLQIAIATFFLNVTISQTLGLANADHCHSTTEGIVEIFKWVTDLEASYRLIQAIGNLITTRFGQETIAMVSSVDSVINKIRSLTSTTHSEDFKKINSAGLELLSSFWKQQDTI